MENKNNLEELTDGRSKMRNRLQGSLAISLSGIFEYLGFEYDISLLKFGAPLFTLDGIGDLITGYHHYTSQIAYNTIKKFYKKHC